MGYPGVAEDLVHLEACLDVICRQWSDYPKGPVPVSTDDILDKLPFANAVCT